MSLPLNPALVDQILFAMEDQDNFSVLNLETREIEVCQDENACAEGSVLPIPAWSSADGFRMMREFCEGLRNPSVQAELREVLDSGHGVFRRFKAVLKPRDLLYRQWLRFKRRFMEDKISLWLDQWPEVAQEETLDPSLGVEPRGLLASDFSFREGHPDEADRLESWDAEGCLEAAQEIFGPSAGPAQAAYFRRGRRFAPGDRFWVAEDPQSDWAGVVWARNWTPEDNGPGAVEILLWYVDPGYRGLGLGKVLLENVRSSVGPNAVLLLTTPADLRIDGALTRSGFQASGKFWVSPGA